MDQSPQVQCSSPPIPASKISMKALHFLSKSLLYISELISHPISSILTTSLLLIILYVPRPLLPILLSPVPICTSFLLYSLLRFGSKPASTLSENAKPEPKPETHPELVPSHDQNSIFLASGFEWALVGGPLEVIYEDYEGEEDGESPENSPSPAYPKASGVIGFGSLGGFYLTDSDSGSDSEELRFRWDEDDEGDEGMIEIAFEEDNLIEIDISYGCR
ncbi:hypothetical protein J5N97_027158 [Dioscorea zingiberensis]|uniref:Uncharacterized protein n=1 Tax=Dioscorea zingiberensis TaxID=325984 RepID=A0A9D5C3P4_9LILI|nr:hypothetical protein J5N97_027158 [Dioscorea zingiberensis]